MVRAGSGWSGRRLQVAALGGLVGLAAAAVLAWSGASAVFSVTTTNPASSLATTTWVPHVLNWFGDGGYGQSGTADLTPDHSPGQESTAATTWNAVAAGERYNCATRTGGTLWCWGLNEYGQLGVGSLTEQASPVQVAGTTWGTVSAGTGHTCATKTDGTLWCWGLNGNGQLGIGSLIQQTSPVQVGVLTTWATVDAGESHTCATKTGGGALWCWGLNSTGQLGIGSLIQQTSPVQVGVLTTWATVAAGFNHTCATRTDFTLWCWGNNDTGQLGIGSMVQRTSPFQVGVLITWNTVSAGYYGACATKTDGTLWCWGDNSLGQAGIGSIVTPQTSPVRVGAAITTWATVAVGGGAVAGRAHACATRTDFTMWCWGDNALGQTGIGSVATGQTSPVQVGALTTWSTVAAGGIHACATKGDGTLWCWGGGALGQLGNGSPRGTSTALQISSAVNWTSVAVAAFSTCATRTDGTLWCWGDNTAGQLGLGSTTPQYSPTQVGGTTWATVTSSWQHTCATRTDGTLWCWGLNDHGQVGIGSLVQQTSPVQVGVLTTWSTVHAAAQHTCATRTDGTLWCWGNNTQGQVGIGSVASPQTSPVRVGAAITNWATVAGGAASTCATRSDGTLWCWGFNGDGRVGIGSVATPQTSPVRVGAAITNWATVSVGATHACATRTDGTLWCWGGNNNGQVGIGSVVTPQISPVQVSVGITTWRSVAGGFMHTCANRTDNSVWCWGANWSGQNGLGDYAQRTSPVQLAGVTAIGVYSGNQAAQTFIFV